MAFSEVISEDNLSEVVGEKLVNDLHKAMDDANCTGFDVAYSNTDDDTVIQCYDALCTKFKEKTGMELSANYLDGEVDSDVIVVGELYWEVDTTDMWVKSPSLIAFEAKYGEVIERGFYSF